MQIKRFEAKTMTAALKMVKDEFGVNAVILSARSLRRSRGLFGIGGDTGVEVTAANDTADPVHPAAGRPPLPRPERIDPPEATEPPPRRGWLQALNGRLRSLARPRRSSAPIDAAPPPEIAGLYHHLLSQEVSHDLAGDLIEQIQRLPDLDPLRGEDGLTAPVAGVLHDMGLRAAADAPKRVGPRILVLVGPRGAGKTTLATKLATLKAGGPNGKVALLTLDGHRFGTVVQLGILGSILRVPVAVATSGPGVQQKLQAFHSMDWMIVDTPGVSPGEPQRMAELREMVGPLNAPEVHLVLNASIREKDLGRMIDAWKGFPVHRLAFTRLDEAGACGHLLNLLVQTGLPLSYLSTGPRIPEDLADQPLAMLLRRIWPAREIGLEERSVRPWPADIPASMPDTVRRVATRSSVLYHRPDCRWVRKIKSEDLIQFASVAEAESRQFVACRKCRSHRVDRSEADVAWSGLQAAGDR